MPQSHDIFGPGANLTARIMEDYELLGRRVTALRELGCRIVLTAGTFDLFHEGHARYLGAARSYGDILIVGVDDDTKVRRRKGEGRPIDSERQRAEMLCHSRYADLVFLKRDGDPKWQLIRTVRPDILIASEGTYTEEQIDALREFCKEIIVLPPQAATSTTAKLRKLILGPLGHMEAKARELLEFIQLLKHGGKE